MAKARAKTTKPTNLKWGEASDGLAEKGYSRCPIGTCRRDMKNVDAHVAAHVAGTLGDDGRRTDRTAADAKAWAERYNGTEATVAFRVVKSKTSKAAAKKKVVAKKSKSKPAAKVAAA